MSGTILLGYDVETASQFTKGFLEGARRLHEEHEVPGTLYLTGMTVEQRLEDVRRALECPLFDCGQHTYNHILLKSVYMTPGDGEPIHGHFPNLFISSADLETIREELARTNALFEQRLGRECSGLTGPWGYYRGLADRPDLLQILKDERLLWVRSYARDHRDCQPVEFSVQPFFYEDQGFPEILELGIQGYQDDFYWDRFDDRKYGPTYEDYVLATLEKVVDQDLVWNVASHDHHTPDIEAFNENKGWIGDLVLRGKELGARFVTAGDFYAEARAKAGQGDKERTP